MKPLMLYVKEKEREMAANKKSDDSTTLTTIEESKSGKNTKFQTSDGKTMSDKEVVKDIEKGGALADKYYVNKTAEGKKYPASKPDGKKKNNLG